MQSEDPTGVRKGAATQEPKADGSQLVNRAVSLCTRGTCACNVIEMLKLPWQLAYHQFHKCKLSDRISCWIRLTVLVTGSCLQHDF